VDGKGSWQNRQRSAATLNMSGKENLSRVVQGRERPSELIDASRLSSCGPEYSERRANRPNASVPRIGRNANSDTPNINLGRPGPTDGAQSGNVERVENEIVNRL
jgi:hypothetical protein